MFDVSRKFKVTVPNRGVLELGPNDHVASGGEGHVYRKGGLAVKIWDEPDRAAKGRMPEKMKLLQALRHPFVVVPDALVLDAKASPVGICMPWVDKSWALPLAFTNDWRAAHGFDDAKALSFASKMREAVSHAHSKGAVMGDANEMNILGVDGKSGPEPRYIDVDPWVLPGFPGDKVLPTIRDRHSPAFSKEADWFAYAAVTFQLLIGIHPYRGTHPSFGRTDLDGRMAANASVFGKSVRLPAAVRPFSLLPAPLLDWYKEVFDSGLRSPPPDLGLHAPAAARRRVKISSASSLAVVELHALPAPLLRACAPDVALLADGTLISLPDGRIYGKADPKASFMRLQDGSIAGIRVVGERLEFGVLRAAPGASMAFEDSGLAASSAWSSENRLFAKVHDGILEILPRELGPRTAALPGRKWSLNPNSTFFGDGAALWDALGAKHLVVPFGASAVAVVRAPALDGLRPIALLRRGRVGAATFLDASGSYKRAVLFFDEAYASCSISLEDADDGSLSDVATDSGVLARIAQDGKLDLFVPASGARRLVDADVSGFDRLLTGPSGTFGCAQGKIFRLSVR